MERLKEVLSQISGGRILDVGSGVGDFVQILDENLKDYTGITGIDNFARSIESARKNFSQENIKFTKMDAERLEFEDNSFDTVCISNTIHHLQNKDIVLKEMMRVLRSDGLFIISEMFCDNQSNGQMSHVLMHHLAAEVDTLLGTCHNKTYEKSEILNIANDLGLKDVKSTEYTFDDEEYSKEELDEVAISCDKIVERVKDLPQYEELKYKVKEIKAWIFENGIYGATELIIIGKSN